MMYWLGHEIKEDLRAVFSIRWQRNSLSIREPEIKQQAFSLHIHVMYMYMYIVQCLMIQCSQQVGPVRPNRPIATCIYLAIIHRGVLP